VDLRRLRRIGASMAPALALASAAAGCSSPASSASSQDTTTVTTSVSPAASSSGGSQVVVTAISAASGSGAGGGSRTTAATTHSSHKASASPTPSPDPTVLPYVVSITYSDPGCTSRSGTSTVVISWKTKYAAEVYLSESVVAFYADPRTSGGVGPLPGDGSETMPFNCANQYDYYMLGVYNSVGKSGETQQVPNPAF